MNKQGTICRLAKLKSNLTYSVAMSSNAVGRFSGIFLLTICVGAVVFLAAGGNDTASETATGAAVSAGSSDNTAPTDGASSPAPTTTTEAPTLEEIPENLGPRLGLEGLDGWLNTDEISSLDDLDGQVVLVEMWTFGCHNCQARIPHNQELYAAYKDQGFEIVGVHAPEFNHEADIDNIVNAVERLGVTWPVALDTEKFNFRAWQDGGRRFWPRTFLIDQNGDVRYDHIGEGRYDEVEQTVAWLLDNPPT